MEAFVEQLRYFWQEKKSWLIGSICVVGVIFIVLFRWNAEDKKEAVIDELTSATMEQTEEKNMKKEETPPEPAAEKVFVDMKGAVKHPGVYELKTGDRLLDAIEKAGGLEAEADNDQVNLAQKLEDEMVIYIPKKGEEPPEFNQPVTINSESVEKTESESTININTATKEELMQLSGIGAVKAQNIINYREEQGSFKTIEELKEVSGIGERTFEQLKENIAVH